MNRVGWAFVAIVALLAATFGILVAQSPPAQVASQRQSMPIERAIIGARATLVIPVEGVAVTQLTDSWHDAREAGTRVHEALDIAAPMGTPVVAAMAGRVEKIWNSERGGLTVYVRSADGATLAYYAHLSAYAPGLAEGQTVTAGQLLGAVGDSGNAGPGNTHLHFAVHQMAPGEPWHGGTPINPYPLLVHSTVGG